jgi:hypothetical protein
MVSEGGESLGSRATYGFRLAVSRKPSPAELDRILTFYRQQLTRYQKDPKAAAKILQADHSARVEQEPELAAWTMVANVLLNMDETISKD